MLPWLSILGGVALLVAVIALVVTMSRAERRARRNLFRALGLADETVELLMARNSNILAGLALVRVGAATSSEPDLAEPDAPATVADTLPHRLQPTIRLVHPAPGEARPAGGPRRQPYSGRRRL
jgi:predicted lysophospholipase L1 biosynthesis ABC-type transport system permease subunit